MITSDEEEEDVVALSDDEDRPAVVSINNNNSSSSNSGEDMTMTIRRIDALIDRSESMRIEQKFNTAVESAVVQYACDEVNRVMHLEDDEYIPSTASIKAILRWASIEVITYCSNTWWQERMADRVREVLIERQMN